MPPAIDARLVKAQVSTQDVFSGVLAGLQTPPSGITGLQRLANLNPSNYRIHAGTDGGITALALPFNAPYTASDGLTVGAWSFAHLNALIQNAAGRTSGPLVLNVRYAPDNMFTGTGPMGGNGNAPGVLADQTYSAFASYMANLVRYYNTSTPPPGANPWPRDPGIGPITYWEIWNEPDYSSENPRVPPILPAPSVTLTGVSVVGGTLVPGQTYSYQITPLTSTNDEGLPSAVASIVLPPGMNAVRLAWTASSNLGRRAAAYTVYGRGGKLVVVGKDNAAGLSWNDLGTVVPDASAPPTTDNTAGGSVFSPLEYKALWDAVVPAMKAVDPTIKVVGPATTNPISLSPVSVITTVVTSGPADQSYLDSRDYAQVLSTSTNPPDVFSYHGYGGWQGSADTDAALFARIATMASQVQSNVLPYIGTKPVWQTEANVNAADDATHRPVSALGVAWQGALFAAFATLVDRIHEYSFVESPTFGLITEAGSPIVGAVEGNPYLPYWAIYWIGLISAGAKVLSATPAPGLSVLAVANPPDFRQVKVLVVNQAVPPSSQSVTVSLAGASAVAARSRVIDSTTDLVNGPGVVNAGAVQSLTVALNGHSIALIEFDT